MFRLTNNQISKAILILRAITTHGRPITLRELALLVNEHLKLTRFQRLNLTHPLCCKAPSRAALI